MTSYNNSGGAPTQPPTDDPNPTRYFPPQETPRPEVPRLRASIQRRPILWRLHRDRATHPNPPGERERVRRLLPAPVRHLWAGDDHHPALLHPGAKRDRDRSILAIVLIGGGLLFLLDQFNFFPSFGDMVLLLIGGVFMYAYFSTKPGYKVGFLIPGSILLGIGAGQFLQGFAPIDAIFGGSISAITLGLGFCDDLVLRAQALVGAHPRRHNPPRRPFEHIPLVAPLAYSANRSRRVPPVRSVQAQAKISLTFKNKGNRRLRRRFPLFLKAPHPSPFALRPSPINPV